MHDYQGILLLGLKAAVGKAVLFLLTRHKALARVIVAHVWSKPSNSAILSCISLFVWVKGAFFISELGLGSVAVCP